jgi:hypothetical protein
MTDEELLQRFEAGTLANADLHHGDHVKLAWLYLRRYPVLEVLARLSAGLQAMARACGKPHLYHETITWAYVLLIRERLARAGSHQSWDEFAAAHADLLSWKDGILRFYYRETTLRSDLARAVFLFPDREPVLSAEQT